MNTLGTGMEVGLEVDSVMHAFGEHRVLTDVSLRCRLGEIVALCGRNGAGKSTLMKIIFGTLACGECFVRIDGQAMSRAVFRSGKLAYLPQTDFLPLTMRVEKVVRLFLGECCDFFADPVMARIARTRVRDLSGGELRLLEIRLILQSPARYLLLDEPFNGLSTLAAETVRQQIVRSAETRGIVITDHCFREVFRIATRYVLLRDGCLREVSGVSELSSYLGPRCAVGEPVSEST